MLVSAKLFGACNQIVQIEVVEFVSTMIVSFQRYEVQTILSKRYPEDKLNSTTIKYATICG